VIAKQRVLIFFETNNLTTSLQSKCLLTLAVVWRRWRPVA